MTPLIALVAVSFVGVVTLGVILKMLGNVNRSLERYADRAFALEESNRRMEREHVRSREALTKVEAHFVYPPVTEPVPLPSMDETYAEAPRGKKRRK